jgi:hypothetical protein
MDLLTVLCGHYADVLSAFDSCGTGDARCSHVHFQPFGAAIEGTDIRSEAPFTSLKNALAVADFYAMQSVYWETK